MNMDKFETVENLDEKLICERCKLQKHDLNRLKDPNKAPIWLASYLGDDDLVCDDCLEEMEEDHLYNF